MEPTHITFLVSLGFVVGILSGLLGVGGGILSVPALVFLPNLLGFEPYSVHMATGISAATSLISGITSVITHYRKGSVVMNMVIPLLCGALIGGLLGGMVSSILPDLILYLIFAMVLLTTVIFAFIQPSSQTDTPDPDKRYLGFLEGTGLSFFISFLAANIGIGGGVMLNPILIYIKKCPVRWAIGTGSVLVLFTSISATIGKWLVHLIPFPDVLWVTLGAFFGGAIGASISHKLPPFILRKLLLLVATTTLIRILLEIIHHYS